LDSETVSSLVQIGRAALIRFYSDLGEQMDRGHGPLLELVPEDGALAFLRHLPRIADALLPPVTDDHRRVPRVEVRGSNAAVVWVGIPSSIAELYHHVPEQMLELVDGKPTGRMCVPPTPISTVLSMHSPPDLADGRCTALPLRRGVHAQSHLRWCLPANAQDICCRRRRVVLPS
jgi:hypothetical protein